MSLLPSPSSRRHVASSKSIIIAPRSGTCLRDDGLGRSDILPTSRFNTRERAHPEGNPRKGLACGRCCRQTPQVCTLISQNVKKERVLESTVSLPPRGFESLRVNEVQGFLAKERYSDATRVRFAEV